jgi:hypothetical protein
VRAGRLVPRLRFETALDEAAEQIRYRGGFRVPDLLGTPAPGWSTSVQDTNGAPFDASRLAWEDDFRWESVGAIGPRRLTFTGRTVRVFVPATRFGMGGLVEGDDLPASGRCWVAAAAGSRIRLTRWLEGRPANSYTEENVALPTGWMLYRLSPVPAEPNMRQTFPSGAESSTPILRLCGGAARASRTGRGVSYLRPAPCGVGGRTGWRRSEGG